jgi:hypothetical protein
MDDYQKIIYITHWYCKGREKNWVTFKQMSQLELFLLLGKG